MRFRIENMSRTIGIFTESSDRNPEIDLFRLCWEKHDCYYSIFTSNVACEITVKDALHDLVGLQVAVGDGLPTTMCPLCLKKLTEFSVFKKICLESNAILRKCLPRSCFRSFEGRGADDEESEPCVETKDCVQDVIENTSEFACSAQMTEVYIPMPDCLLPRDDKLETVKEENKDPLSEDNYPEMYTQDPAKISSNALDTLATDDLSGMGAFGSPCVKADQISDDGGGYEHNDSTGGATNSLVAPASVQETVKEENEDPLSEGKYPVMNTPDPAVMSSNALDPLATDDLSGVGTCGSPCVNAHQTSDDGGGYVHNDSTDLPKNDRVAEASVQAQASTSSQGKEVDSEGTRAAVIDLDTLLVLAKNELSPKETDATEPIVMENEELVQNRTMVMECITEAVGECTSLL